MRHALLAVLAFALAIAAAPVSAETRAEFQARIQAAFVAPDKKGALLKLFRLADVDVETRGTYQNMIVGRMLARYDAPSGAFEPLPAGFDPVYVMRGYEYRPNIAPRGIVVLNGKTRVPYGLHGGRYYLVAAARTRIEPTPGPDRTLQMMAVGMGHPTVRFDGHCDVMQGNGKLKRMTLGDEGRGNQTAIITAQFIKACELRKRSPHGTLWLRLQEGDGVVFDHRIELPETTIVYRRAGASPGR